MVLVSYSGCPSRPGIHSLNRSRFILRSQVGNKTFRICKWMEMLGTSTPARAILERAVPVPVRDPTSPDRNIFRPDPISVQMGDDVMTYSTLDSRLYTPTPTKPWRGIWVGDYSSHGSEFILFHQSDDEPATCFSL